MGLMLLRRLLVPSFFVCGVCLSMLQIGPTARVADWQLMNEVMKHSFTFFSEKINEKHVSEQMVCTR